MEFSRWSFQEPWDSYKVGICIDGQHQLAKNWIPAPILCKLRWEANLARNIGSDFRQNRKLS